MAPLELTIDQSEAVQRISLDREAAFVRETVLDVDGSRTSVGVIAGA